VRFHARKVLFCSELPSQSSTLGWGFELHTCLGWPTSFSGSIHFLFSSQRLFFRSFFSCPLCSFQIKGEIPSVFHLHSPTETGGPCFSNRSYTPFYLMAWCGFFELCFLFPSTLHGINLAQVPQRASTLCALGLWFLTLLFESHVSTATQSPYLKCLLGRVHAGLVNLLTKAGRFLSFFKKSFHTDWLSIHGTARLTFGARSPPRYGDTWVLLPFYK
jgi:hypothetical protein